MVSEKLGSLFMFINWLELIPIKVHASEPSRSMSNRSGYQGSFMMDGYMVRMNILLVKEYEYTNGRVVCDEIL